MPRFVLVAAAALVVARGAAGDSIWAKAQGRSGTQPVALYEDDKAHAIGDILTIIVQETSDIENQTTRSSGKTSTRSVEAGGSVNLQDVSRLWGGHPSGFKLPSASADSDASSKFEGNAKYDSARTIEDQITVVVHDILPNGNLVVMGQRRRHVDGDTQVIRISGIVRPSDISFYNTVRSELVADFHMAVQVKGPEPQWTKPGWLGRLLNWVSPW